MDGYSQHAHKPLESEVSSTIKFLQTKNNEILSNIDEIGSHIDSNLKKRERDLLEA